MVLAVATAAEWIRAPDALSVWLAWGACVASIVGLRPWAEWRSRALVAALVALALALGVADWQLNRIDHVWPEQREARVEAASRRLAGDLHAAFHQAEQLAARAAVAAARDRTTAFPALERLIPDGGPEAGVTILDRAGTPWAWAGRHRIPPEASGDSIASRATPYYVVLEARRHSAGGRVAVASVLIWAHPAVPERSRSLAELFRATTEVGLTVFPPGSAPDSADVFDYAEPTTAGPRLLFSVQPIPPEQGQAKELARTRGQQAVAWALTFILGLSLMLASAGWNRFLLLLSLLWLVVRAPLGGVLGIQPAFSPATFFRPLLGPLTASAGVLALTGTLLTTLAVWLWRRRLPRRWYGVAGAVSLLVLAPYLVRGLARGITPPASGVSISLWLTWQLTLVTAASALILVSAALLRGQRPTATPAGRRVAFGRVALGVALSVGASVVGVLVWSPRGGWPDWYAFLWVPALLLVALPAPRWAAVTGIAIVGGSLAALVTWGAELRGRLDVAQRDVARLGSEPDALAVPLLERLAGEVRRAPPAASATEIYALWRQSALAEQRYPVQLALWSPAGRLRAELSLDSLDLPPALISQFVRALRADDSVRVTPVPRVPGMHYVLLTRVGDEVLTAAVGPRTELIERSRLGRLLNPGARESPHYRLVLSPPTVDVAPGPQRLRWRREGWTLRAERSLELLGTVRRLYAVIDLRGPVPLFARGALVVLLDVVVLASLWSLAELAAGARPRRPRWRGLARSFRIRLFATLALFFLIPAVGFSAWGFARLADEAERGRDLLITQTLRDAIIAADGLPPTTDTAAVRDRLDELSRRVDADLALYEGGALVATSAPILRDLGVVSELMDPAAFQVLALGRELEVTRDATIPTLAERVGYRVVRPGAPEDLTVLATPQRADESSLASKQLDLALVLLLATLIGVAAALAGAQAAARALSRPVSELRRSALALGQGQSMPPHSRPPAEFEPVFGAFERMATDIRASQSALEEARRRTATVLATVATAVVAVDPSGRVLLANRQAVDLLQTPLAEGEPFLGDLAPEWTSLRCAVESFLAVPTPGGATTELSVGGRRLTLQLASLGPDLRGVVLAVIDVTDVSRAERVLAWGDMARQVAHEIKNPLTPMRLGMQHLRRAYRDRRGDFDQTLEETAARILGEIDRLDTIARAFSRFAAPVDDQRPLERVDLSATAGEVVQLYRLAAEGADVRLETANGEAWGAARQDEVKEVLVNLLENARNAEARTITVGIGPGQLAVIDDGAGIPPELLSRIFEPSFSTTTSGSGLGLPIVRRLVESWGGVIEVESEVGRGTSVRVRLAM